MQVEDVANTMPVSTDACFSRDTNLNISPVSGVPHTHPHVYPHRPQHILIVEDDLSLAKPETDVLTTYGYAVTAMHSRESKLDQLPKPYLMQTLLKRVRRMLMIAS